MKRTQIRAEGIKNIFILFKVKPTKEDIKEVKSFIEKEMGLLLSKNKGLI